MLPSSCDTFVALPPSTEGQRIIFGKNSDRPCDEVQEVVYFPATDYSAGEKVEVGDKDSMLLPSNLQFPHTAPWTTINMLSPSVSGPSCQ